MHNLSDLPRITLMSPHQNAWPHAATGGSPVSNQAVMPTDQTALSPREKEVLDLLAQDYLDKEIAAELGISFNTVRTHLHHIFQKLQVRTRTGAVVRFLMKDEG